MKAAFGWLIAACCWSGLSLAEVDPAAQLERMQRAGPTLSYEGVVVYSRDGQLDALRIRHGIGTESSDSIERLTGPALPFQRRGENTWLGDGPNYSASGIGQPGVLPDALQGYDLQHAADDRVAGRATHVIDARPRDAMRYGRRYWVDQDTGVVLRAAVFGADGIMVEQWMFTSFELSADSTVAPLPTPQEAVTYSATSATAMASTRMQVMDPPVGFQMISASADSQGEQLVFSDGLAKVSVFVERLPAADAVLSGLQRRGATSVFGRIFDGLQVVVVGEVPPSTAERFAQGVVRRDAG